MVPLKQAHGVVRTSTGPISSLPDYDDSLSCQKPAANVPDPDEDRYLEFTRSHERLVRFQNVLCCWGCGMLVTGLSLKQDPAANVPEQVLSEEEVCTWFSFEGAGDERLNFHPACRRCSLGSSWMAPRTSSSAWSTGSVV